MIAPSGFGKTTIFREVAYLVNPMESAVYFQGKVPEAIGYPAFRWQVVLVNQRPIMLDASIEDNLKGLFWYRHIRSAHSPRDQALELFDRLGIGGHCLLKPA